MSGLCLVPKHPHTLVALPRSGCAREGGCDGVLLLCCFDSLLVFAGADVCSVLALLAVRDEGGGLLREGGGTLDFLPC